MVRDPFASQNITRPNFLHAKIVLLYEKIHIMGIHNPYFKEGSQYKTSVKCPGLRSKKIKII